MTFRSQLWTLAADFCLATRELGKHRARLFHWGTRQPEAYAAANESDPLSGVSLFSQMARWCVSMREHEFKLLLSCSLLGDADAESQLYVYFKPDIERVIAKHLRNLHLLWAVDPQDVFDSVWLSVRHRQRLKSIDNASSFMRYLRAAVRKKTLEIHRKMTARKRDIRRTCSLTFEPQVIGSEFTFAELELLELVTLARQQLSPRELIICSLCIAGRSWCEIAGQLGCSADAARMVRLRAEQRIRAWIQNSE